MRICMSRHSSGPAGVAAPVVGDAGAAGEGDAAVDDQRLAMRAVVEAAELYQRIGLYQATWQPPLSSVVRISVADVDEPIASSRIFTVTPARACSASARGELRPISPAQ